MNTVKNGSRGSDVTTLQNALNKAGGYGLTADGIFGPKTEAAVKDFQKKKGLSVDGICGPKTWAALGYNATSNTTSNTTSSKCIDPSVIFKPLSVALTKCKTKRTPKYLAIHYTAGASSAAGRALKNYDTFVARAKTKKPGSADFAVDDAEMVQFNPDIENYYCWAVGGDKWSNSGGKLYGQASNSNTVSIEICSNLKSGTSGSAANHEGWYFTEAALNNAVKLAKMIMKKYNIPLDRVIRHYDVNGKTCPGVPGWNDEAAYTTAGVKTSTKYASDKWKEFKNKLK